jgi:hypothetical protein
VARKDAEVARVKGEVARLRAAVAAKEAAEREGRQEVEELQRSLQEAHITARFVCNTPLYNSVCSPPSNPRAVFSHSNHESKNDSFTEAHTGDTFLFPLCCIERHSGRSPKRAPTRPSPSW